MVERPLLGTGGTNEAQRKWRPHRQPLLNSPLCNAIGLETWDWQPEPARQRASSIPVLGPEVEQEGTQAVAHLSVGGHRAAVLKWIHAIFWSWQHPPAICRWPLRLGLLYKQYVCPTFLQGGQATCLGSRGGACLLFTSPSVLPLFLPPL